jgi:Zn-dependent peptidase ImmA (M78 family)
LVLKLIEAHNGTDPEEVIEAHAERLLRESEQSSLPVEVALISSLLGIRRRVASVEFAGRIYAEESGQLVMDLNVDDADTRRRFTEAHELTHVAFPGFKREARYRADIKIGTNPPNREEEYLCDRGAAALLMPRSLIEGTYDVDDGLEAVERLSEDADVSLEAAGNRLVSLSKEPAVFLVLSMANKPADARAARRGDSAPKRLRLRYATASRIDLYLPRYKSADDASVFYRAWESWNAERGFETLPGAPRSDPFAVEAKAYGSDENRRVLAIGRPRRVGLESSAKKKER